MKGAVIALLCAAALAQAEINENGCPINPYVEILKPHPNCNKYYQCTQGELKERRCASDLVFDVVTQSCDWAKNVDCNDRLPPLTPDSSEEDNQPENENGGNSDPSEAPKICAEEGSDGVLVAHENCNQFYVCDAGAPVARECFGILQFNPVNNQCDWPDNVNCADRVVGGGDGDNGEGSNEDGGNGGSGGNSDPSEAPEICAAEGSDGILVAHENCNQFYNCLAGKPVAQRCSGDLLFNPANNQCDWPDNVNCGDRVVGGGDGGNGDGSNEDGGNGGSGGNSDPSEAPEICAAEGSDGILVAHENCNQFYNCLAGKPVAQRCSGNLLFNPANNQCDWPDNVNCGDRVVGGGDGGNGDGSNEDGGNGGSGGNSDPSEAPEICAAEGSDGILVAHENCNQFYNCLAGKPVAQRCSGNLLFNPANNQCDWPDNVNCEDRVTGGGDGGNGDGSNEDGGNGGSGGNSDPSEAPEICAAEGSDGILVAHENCNQFYNCLAGKPVAQSCWGNLLFNPATNQCDWPDVVKCSDRIVDGGNSGEDNGNGDGGNGGGDNGDGSAEDNGGNGGGNDDHSKAEEICAIESLDDVLVAHEECNKFYQCKAGRPVVRICYSNLYFNPSINSCDWPDNVNCGNRKVPASFNKPTRHMFRLALNKIINAPQASET